MILFLLAACVPQAPSPPRPCDVSQPASGQIRVGPICEVIEGGEAGRLDVALDNAFLRSVIRHPQASRTLPGLGGGTLVDVAPWGRSDGVHEIVPLIDGGWLSVDTLDVEPDGVVVRGVTTALPGAPGIPSRLATVRWRLDPDSPTWHVEGADGLLFHPRGGGDLVDDVFLGDVHVATDGVAHDLGGAIVFDGATRITIAAPGGLDSLPVRITGTAPSADAIELGVDGAVVARIALGGDAFDLSIPDVDAVRAVARGRAASAWTAPGRDLVLTPGAPGLVRVHTPGPATVAWRHEDGRVGAVRADGVATLPTGAGPVTITVTDGPVGSPTHTRLVVGPRTPTVSLAPADTARDVAPVSPRWVASRSRTWRGTDAEAVTQAAQLGLAAVALAPADDIPEPVEGPIPVTTAATLTHPDGWTITAWPFSPHPRLAGHGAPNLRPLDPVDALGAAWAGPANDRTTVVDLAWLDAAPHPALVPIHPTAVWLDPPGDTLDAWAPWFTWLDAGAYLPPMGPVTWIPVVDRHAVQWVEVERSLALGTSVAGTGPRIALTVDGVGPGGRLHRARPALPLSARIEATEGVQRVHLVADGVIRASRVGPGPHEITLAAGPAWVLAVAMAPNGAWATTGPVWLDAP